MRFQKQPSEPFTQATLLSMRLHFKILKILLAKGLVSYVSVGAVLSEPPKWAMIV